MTDKKNTTPRRPSWQCLDLAFKIQIPNGSAATKLVLLYLAKSVNDSLRCYPSYDAIKDHTGIASRTTISDAITYLRDELLVLSWRKGGGAEYGVSNHYRFDLKTMRDTVKKQGIFCLTTGKRIQSSPATGQDTSPVNGLDTSPPTGLGRVQSAGERVQSADERVQPLDTNALVIQRSGKSTLKKERSEVPGEIDLKGSGLSDSKQTDLKLPPGFVRRDGAIINTNSGGTK